MNYSTEINKFYRMTADEYANRVSRFAAGAEVIHACLGLSGETGEVVDILKKHYAYGKALDYQKLAEELGDCLHYLTRLIHLSGFSEEFIKELNINKLNARYPKGYSNQDAINQTEKE